jgi:hypothetical protein
MSAQPKAKSTLVFDNGRRCTFCKAPSRRLRPQTYICQAGHTFTWKAR